MADARRSIAVLSFSMVVVMVGFGMVIPLFPFFIESLGVGGSELGVIIAIASLMEFIFAPIWGSVSDRVGRKPVLLIGLVGYFFGMLLIGLSRTYPQLLLIRAASGIMSSATLPTSMAYVSDVTSDDERANGIGTLGAAMGLGVIIGPGLGGVLGSDNIQLPFFISALLSLVAAMLVLITVPESLKTSAQSIEIKSPLSGLRNALTDPIGVLFLLAFFLSFGLTNFEAIFGLYFSGKFGFGPKRVGIILMIVGVTSTLGKALLTGPMSKTFGDDNLIKGSLLAGSICFALLLYANTYPLVLGATALFILSKTLLRPSILALISKNTDMGQGAIMGLSNSFMSLGRIIGPLWAGYVFDLNYNYPYMSGALILFIGFLISLRWKNGA